MNRFLKCALYLLGILSLTAGEAGRAPRESLLDRDLRIAARALGDGKLEAADQNMARALERDANAVKVWNLEARIAAAWKDLDREVYARHKELRLRRSQGFDARETKQLESQLQELDPLSIELLKLREKFTKVLRPLADEYEKEGWPHSAISVHKEILVLDAENQASQEAIDRLASLPDPSLAADAKQVDLLEGVSAEFLAEFDAEHSEWKSRAKLERKNYVTHTNAGYEVLLRAAEAMEQMNAFYRRFFGLKQDKGVSRIDLHIFKNRDEYLEKGIGPPVEWSGGHFTGNAVETYVGQGGFSSVTGTLFHEAAHQFVSLATSASGWLNEGLASFFEGCQILSNGSVLMNQPAPGRLFPLASRMDQGWMSAWDDGIEEDPSTVPRTAPSLRIVIENRYQWGPAWYAPTWGLVFFLYNFQDPVDGRFIYRAAFREFIDRSGGLSGTTAIEVFEELVLANPLKPTEGTSSSVRYPDSIDQINETWKEWILALRDEQTGKSQPERPYLQWAEYAIQRKQMEDALEFFEKGLVATPADPNLLLAFGEFLVERKELDRAVKLLRHCAFLYESGAEDSGGGRSKVKSYLRKLDPKLKRLAAIHSELAETASAIPSQYLAQGLNLMAMDTALRLGQQLRLSALDQVYHDAVKAEGRSLAQWQLAYNEENLDGWDASGASAIRAEGNQIKASFGAFKPKEFNYITLGLDVVTSGDFSLEAELKLTQGKTPMAGLVFGQKATTDFHALILFPPSEEKGGFADLASFYGGQAKTWRRSPMSIKDAASEGSDGRWYRVRVDVTGTRVDMWVNDQPVATQIFPSLDVLRGSFGIIVGNGESDFRRVRYLARNPLDPAAAILAELRDSERALASAGGAINGSWIGLRPPFPEVTRWAQDPRTSWEEAAGSPQLLVLFGAEQNEKIRISKWLRGIHEEYSNVGLSIVNIIQFPDDDKLDAHLAEHPFPGSVGSDKPGEDNNGQAFVDFEVARFNLPRILLLDTDGKVVWEGDPGFSFDTNWSGEDTLLSVPLEKLIEKRQLVKLQDWRQRWRSTAEQLFELGQIADFTELLREADGFDASSAPEVAQAQAKLKILRAAVEDPEATWASLESLQAELAMGGIETLAKALETPLPSKLAKSFKKAENFRAWKRATSALRAPLAAAKKGKQPEVSEKILAKLSEAPGLLVGLAQQALESSLDDPEALGALLRDWDSFPDRWLMNEFFGW